MAGIYAFFTGRIARKSITPKDTCISTIDKVTIRLPGRGDPRTIWGWQRMFAVNMTSPRLPCSTGAQIQWFGGCAVEGTEILADRFRQRCEHKWIAIHYIRPKKQMQNGLGGWPRCKKIEPHLREDAVSRYNSHLSTVWMITMNFIRTNHWLA